MTCLKSSGLVRKLKIIKSALYDTAYYPIKNTVASNLSASIPAPSVHLYPLSFRNLHAHLNSYFACVHKEFFRAFYYPIPLSSAFEGRSKDKTKNLLPPNISYATRPRYPLARSLHRFSVSSAPRDRDRLNSFGTIIQGLLLA